MSTVAIIGMGTMGQAIASRLKGTYTLIAIDKSTGMSQITQADVVIIAVKPQSFIELAVNLKKYTAEQDVISIMAGITTDTLKKNLGVNNIVRTMPTLALTSGKSLTAAIGNKTHPYIQSILNMWGDVLWLEDESQFDAFTALAGCGPAYFLELAVQLEQQAHKLGFDPKDSQLIANKTLQAAATILGDESAAARIKAKSTEQGVTEVALAIFVKNRFSELVEHVVEVAKKRSEELSK